MVWMVSVVLVEIAVPWVLQGHKDHKVSQAYLVLQALQAEFSTQVIHRLSNVVG
jgi:hypothetical protein